MIAPQTCDLEQAAQEFTASRTAAARERLCEAALPLVRKLAASVLRRLPSHFVSDDLIGDGCVGLLKAIDRFDASRGMRFEVWAAKLIRGSMLNGLRTMDLIPERVRRDARNLDRARWGLAQHQGHAPTDAAAAAQAGLSSQKLRAVLLALRRALPASLDVPPPLSIDQTSPLGERLPGEAADPANTVARRSVASTVAKAVRTLPPRERLIIAAFYSGDTTFRVIGGRLGISKQRVSQIHGRAIESLRMLLAPELLNA